ncbi:MAG TPA: SIS domain-containing protein [Chryseosolibacter sp.]|nr:SIS domain-containing protein [Chryseosolibacter sp.]
MTTSENALNACVDYARRHAAVIEGFDWSPVGLLAEELLNCWRNNRHVFLCGNGGSAGNAVHLANDFLYGISKKPGSGLKVTALPANVSVVTCLGNDQGYDMIFSLQLAVLANPGDVLIVLSGSGNSPNIVRVLEQAKSMGVKSYAVLGYSGGRAKAMADVPIHFPVNDMQIAEDLQLTVGHMLMQWLYTNHAMRED